MSDVPLLFPLLLLLFLGIPILGLLQSSRRPPLHGSYWIALGLFLFVLLSLGVGFGFSAVRDYERFSRLAWWHSIPLVVLVLGLGLLANAFWVRDRFRQLPAGLGEDERKESWRRLSRRLWFPLCGLSVLLVFIPFIASRTVSAPAPLVVSARTPGTPPVPPSPLALSSVDRLDDGSLRIALIYRFPNSSFDLEVVAFCDACLNIDGKKWPCEFVSPAELKGSIPAEISLILRAPAEVSAGRAFLLFTVESERKSLMGRRVSALGEHIELVLP